MWGWLVARYGGVEGGMLLKGPFRSFADKTPAFKNANNALFMAPAWKWGLSIVPLVGAIRGEPSVENLDLNLSLALSTTGIIWSYYGLMVRPTAYLLVAVNVCLLGVNGYNVVRKVKFDGLSDTEKAAFLAANKKK